MSGGDETSPLLIVEVPQIPPGGSVNTRADDGLSQAVLSTSSPGTSTPLSSSPTKGNAPRRTASETRDLSPSKDQKTSPRMPYVPDRQKDGQMFHKMKFYGRLGLSTDGVVVPAHILPDTLFAVPLFGAKVEKGTQKSWQSIFSIWNTMMGTSLLTMPWGFQQAGWAGAIGLTLFLGSVTYYTSYLILVHSKGFEDFSDVCQHYLGKTGYVMSLLASLAILVGAALALDSIMAGCLFSVGEFFRKHFTGEGGTGHGWWQPNTAVFLLILLVFPALMLKDISVLVRANSFGVISLVYLLIFLSYNFINAGFAPVEEVPAFSNNFVYLAGILFVSFFVHNVLLSIMKNQEKPQHNVRDLTIAYALVGGSYALIGILGYMSNFGGAGVEKPQNILMATAFDDMAIGTFMAKFMLLFQLLSVFPIIIFIIRSQAFEVLLKGKYNQVHVFFLNLVMMTACTLISIFYPHIGTILRFAGAVCGLVYEFMLPIGVAVMALRAAGGDLSVVDKVKYATLMVIGLAIFTGQFI